MKKISQTILSAGARRIISVRFNRSSHAIPPLILNFLQFIKIRKKSFAFSRGACPLCDRRTIFIKFYDNEWGVNCIRCGATPPIMSIVGVLKELVGNDLNRKTVYEMSASGSLYKYLFNNSENFYCSEFFEDIEPGNIKNGIECQDVQALAFNNDFFDIVTCTEIFEHVPSDVKGFTEIYRCLKPHGIFLFIVPLQEHPTVERAVLINGKIIHKLQPEYHYDPLRDDKCLCFRNYGPDIVDRLRKVGFNQVRIVYGKDFSGWGYGRYVVLGKKEMESYS